MNTTLFEQKRIAYYIQNGTGMPLVFIHGFCQDSSVWDNFIIRFPERHIIRIDIPGFGNSEQINDYSIARFAEVIYTVLKELSIEKCFFIGHSMGGYIGLEFAKKYRSMLKGLCLFHSHPYVDSASKKESRRKSIEFIKTNGAIYYVKQLMPVLFTPNYRNSNHLELAKLVFTASKYAGENIIASLEAMIDRNDNTSMLKDIKCPLLFIIGKEDTVVPNYIADTALADIASIYILKNVSHMGMLEDAKKCERIIKDFVEFIDIGF